MSIDVGVVQYEALVERTKSNEEILQQVEASKLSCVHYTLFPII